jgi:uncharacterized protein (DUF433 family)
MVAELKQHIELRGDDPYDAVIVDTQLKACLVAQFAMSWGIDEAAQNYELSVATIYAALAFYYDNLDSIRKHETETEQQFTHLREESKQRFESLKQRYTEIKNQND